MALGHVAGIDQAAVGVIDGLSFLQAVKGGSITSVPERVAVLTGGDSAMDAAITSWIRNTSSRSKS